MKTERITITSQETLLREALDITESLGLNNGLNQKEKLLKIM